MEYVFICGWPLGPGKGGVDQYTFDPVTGALTYVCTLDEKVNFGSAFVNREKNVLYALNETKNSGGGRIFSYKLDPVSGETKKISETPTFCLNPAYLGIDPSGRFAVVANHSFSTPATLVERDENGKYHAVLVQNDAAVELFSIEDNGDIGELLDVVKHTGSSIGARQDMPHPHSAVFSPDGHYFAVCDKGNDRVYTYKIDAENAKLFPASAPQRVQPGYMPRYACFHPTRPFFYHNNEGNGFVSAYVCDADGNLTPVGEYFALPETYSSAAKPEQQGLCIHPSGKYLYDAVNGSECVAVFEIDQQTGALTLVQNLETGSQWTRGIVLSPDARHLIVTCLKGEKIIVLGIDGDGRLSRSGFEYDRNAAAFAAFWQA